MDSISDEMIYIILKYTGFKISYVNSAFTRCLKVKAANLISKSIKGHIKKLSDSISHPDLFKRHALKDYIKRMPLTNAVIILESRQIRYILSKYLYSVMIHYDINAPSANEDLVNHIIHCFRSNSSLEDGICTASLIQAMTRYRSTLMSMPLSALINEIHF